MTRTVVAISVVSGALLAASAATAGQQATFISAGYKGGTTNVDVVLDVPKNVDDAARVRGKDWGVHVTLSYTSVNQTFETLDSGRVSIASTTLGGNVDSNTVAIIFQIPIGAAPPPGGSPGYTATVELLRPGT